jgi:uncharacterized DUF497 family protein
MRFEWDDEKSRTNKTKHDIDFDTASVRRARKKEAKLYGEKENS